MNARDGKQASNAFANFSETKRSILNDIRATWGKFSEADLERLDNNDDLVSQIAERYDIDRMRAQRDVDAVMQGRQI